MAKLDALPLYLRQLSLYKPARRFNIRSIFYRYNQAAVAMIVHQHKDQGWSLFMIERAEYKGDLWSGHMAFPGGKKDKASDNSNIMTACRETHEEVGVQLKDKQHHLTHLKARTTVSIPKKGAKRLQISPHVFYLSEEPELLLNEEVANTFWIPLDFFKDPKNRESMQFKIKGRVTVKLPCYTYKNRRIWGLSLRFIDELLTQI